MSDISRDTFKRHANMDTSDSAQLGRLKLYEKNLFKLIMLCAADRLNGDTAEFSITFHFKDNHISVVNPATGVPFDAQIIESSITIPANSSDYVTDACNQLNSTLLPCD